MTEVSYTLSNTQIILLSIALIWDFTWKCLAAWKAVQEKERFWFVFLLLINSVGVVPIIYLAYKKYAKA